MAKIDSLEPLMIDELRDLLDAEKQVAKALPKMAKAASSEQLRAAFELHRQQTDGQIERLNQVFEQLGERPKSKTCEGMKGLIEEGQDMMSEVEAGPTRDALLIAAAQKVEHYEMASYGTARTFANQLGHKKAAGLLEQTLKEEKATDEKLTSIAESISNPQAASERGREQRSTRGASGFIEKAMDWSGIGGAKRRSAPKARAASRGRAGAKRSASTRSRKASKR
ncbi:MAG: ferritin-like domain-containing protein [Bacteroidales bacterium]